MLKTDFNEELKKVNRQTRVLMKKRLEFNRFKRKVALLDEMTVLLERKNQEALIRKAEKPETINIVKPALLPTQPINAHNTASAGLMSVIIGVVLGFVVAFIVETFDTSLGAIEDVEETLGTKVLGVIPQGDVQDIQEELMSKYPEQFKDYSFKHAFGLISHFLPKSMISESFRALRTNIQYKEPGKKAKTLAITSSSPEEGKSMIATNLAITMAQGGMKTLLVGSDLRKPGIDRSFGVDRAPGLTNVLMEEHSWRETVKTVTDIILEKMSWDEIMLTPGLDNLHFITSGTPPQNPAELIDSKRLEEFIEEVKKEYDVIIFDSSPILSTADAAILGMKMDAVLLVYRVGSISKGLLKRTASQLEQVQCNVMGVIINGMKPDISPDFQGYKYYSYYYSYGDGEDQKASKLKKQHLKKPLIMIAALACLAVGFLWQSGLIASLKQSLLGTPDNTVTMKIPTSDLKDPSGRSVKQTEGMVKPTKEPVKSTKELKTTTKGTAKKMSMPPRPVETSKDTKSSIPESPKPIPISLEKEGHREKIKLDKPNSKASSSKVSENHKPDVEGPIKKSTAPKTIALEGKALSERTPAGQAQRKKPTNGAAVLSRPKKLEIHEEYPRYPYSLQLGSFSSIENAKKTVAAYRDRGLPAYWCKVDLEGNGTWFRIYTGFFENREQAKKYQQEAKLVPSIVKKTPYTTFVGIFRDKEQIEQKSLSLENLGYFPYSIRGVSGTYRLFVGTFPNEKSAELLKRDLETKGIQNHVIHR